jgi:hypothetical protein
MQVQCSTCRSKLPAEDVNIDTVLAKCRSCNSVFDFSDQVRLEKIPETKVKRDRGDIPLPRQIRVDDRGRTLEITRRWARGPAFFFLFFSGFWNLIVSIFVVAFLSGMMRPTRNSSGQPPPWFMGLFLTPFVLVGIGTGWAALALLFNTTRIRVVDRRLMVRHGPIWWPGKRDLDTSTLDQLYCEEYVAYTQNNVPQYRFQVQAICKDGSKLKLVRGMEDPGQALYLERLLEKHLGITDRAVRGEFQGGPTS